MDFKLLAATVRYALSQAKDSGIKVGKCQVVCHETNCSKCSEPTASDCLQEEIKQLEILDRQLFAITLQLTNQQSWQLLNQLDSAIHHLQLHQELDADDPDREFAVIINRQPFIIDFNPAAFNDIQRLLHRQIAMYYADDIE